MKKSLGLLLLVGVIAAASIFALRSPKTEPVRSDTPAANASESSASPSQLSLAPSADTAPSGTPAPAKTTPLPVTPSAPVVTTTAPTPTAPRPSAEKVTKHPKTLNELYRAFDAINAAGEATTPESLATLVDFAATENADVRGAALNAIINRDDASVAPLLRKAAKQLDDSKAIIALLETADYIELPSTTMTAIASPPNKPRRASQADHTPPTGSPAPAPASTP